MRTNEPPRIPLYAILLLAVVFIIIAVDSRAGDECRGHSCDDGIDIDITGGDVKNVLTGGDVSNVLTGGDNTATNNAIVGGSRSYSVAAPGLSDVDIAGCLGSTSWSFVTQQLVYRVPRNTSHTGCGSQGITLNEHVKDLGS